MDDKSAALCSKYSYKTTQKNLNQSNPCLLKSRSQSVIDYPFPICIRLIKNHKYDICNSMDGPGGHCAQWNESDGERQIPYDLTYMWNLKKSSSKTRIVVISG